MGGGITKNYQYYRLYPEKQSKRKAKKTKKGGASPLRPSLAVASLGLPPERGETIGFLPRNAPEIQTDDRHLFLYC
jgi:hypothetical protein